MLLQLDFTIETPIYRQIHDQIVLGIASGKLSVGEKLPTVRALAIETGVNVMTVNKAYQFLKSEGHISTDRRGGTVIAGGKSVTTADKVLGELRLPAASAKLSGMSSDEWLDICIKAYKCEEENNNDAT
ncbi:MAG: GntR family transcriptional regulator [Oscillospiraceae bacterium]|nr:GntR family transcriptional regulator [Oscillospiraceae bacterium]